MNIAISSNKKFYRKTLPILLPSLISSGISKNNIKVFIGGYRKNRKKIIDEIEYYYLDNNTFDATSFVGIIEFSLYSDYWFLLHDTCKVGKKFKEMVENPLGGDNVIKISLRTYPSMSIGLYSGEYILSKKDKILSIKNSDYSEEGLLKCKKWHVENEDFLLWGEPPIPSVYPNYNGYEISYPDNWYDSDTDRRTEYYPHIDLYKNKSNWGQTPINNMKIKI